MWIDEIYSLQSAQTVLESGQVIQPVSTLLISASIQSFGTSEWSMRLAPALIGLISVPVLYFLVRKLFDQHVALIAVLLLAISPWHVYWSQNARFYTMLFLLYTGAVVTFFWGLEHFKHRLLLVSLVLLGLALMERLLAAFLVPIVGSYVLLVRALWFKKHAFFRSKKLLLAIALPVLIFGVYELFNLMEGESRVLSFVTKFVGNPNKSPARFLASFIYRVGLPTLCLGTVGGLYLIARRKPIGLYLLLAAIMPPLLLTLAAPFVFTADRYAFVALPGWIILSAVTIKTLFAESTRYGQILVLAVPLIALSDAFVQNALYYTYQNGGRHDWKSAYAFIGTHQRESDVVIAARPLIGEYYLRRTVEGIHNVDTQAVRRSNQRTWFLVNEDVDPDVQQWIDDRSELIQDLDVYIPGNVYGLRLYLFDPVQTRGQTVNDWQE
ncbi:MAG TPA: glycosyltransferase family 39 protein [Anaerolineae bacterium]